MPVEQRAPASSAQSGSGEEQIFDYILIFEHMDKTLFMVYTEIDPY